MANDRGLPGVHAGSSCSAWLGGRFAETCGRFLLAPRESLCSADLMPFQRPRIACRGWKSGVGARHGVRLGLGMARLEGDSFGSDRVGQSRGRKPAVKMANDHGLPGVHAGSSCSAWLGGRFAETCGRFVLAPHESLCSADLMPFQRPRIACRGWKSRRRGTAWCAARFGYGVL